MEGFKEPRDAPCQGCAAEKVLLDFLVKKSVPATVGEGVEIMLRTRGGFSVSELCRELHTSERQLERLFAEHVALPPRKLFSLIRYQNVWRESLSAGFDVQDAVICYGYTDQAHLLHEFRCFHGTSLGKARALALSDSYNTQT